MKPKTLFEKVWEQHEVVPETADTPAVLYVDLHLMHEVTTPQAFAQLRAQGLPVRRPDRTLATLDHSTPTDPAEVFGRVPIKVESAARQVRQMEKNCREFGIELLGLGSEQRGIVHVIGPELGATQPGKTIVCGDSHTARTVRSAPSPSASARPKSATCSRRSACCSASRRRSRSKSTADCATAVTAKDLILAIIGKIGVAGGTGHVIEYRGTRDRSALDGRAHDRLQHVDRGRRTRRHDRARRDDVRVSQGPPLRPAGRRVGRAVERWRDSADRQRRASSTASSRSTRASSSR